jgi:hypothetical protein
MDGFKKREKGGTLESGIEVPPIPRRCHLQRVKIGLAQSLTICVRKKA